LNILTKEEKNSSKLNLDQPFIRFMNINVQYVENLYIMERMWNYITSFHRNLRENIA
jgi:hypothetical protein